MKHKMKNFFSRIFNIDFLAAWWIPVVLLILIFSISSCGKEAEEKPSKQVDIASSMYMEQYDKAYGEIFLYAPEESWNDIRELNEMIHKKNTGEEANKLFLRVVSRLASANAAILKDNK